MPHMMPWYPKKWSYCHHQSLGDGRASPRLSTQLKEKQKKRIYIFVVWSTILKLIWGLPRSAQGAQNQSFLAIPGHMLREPLRPHAAMPGKARGYTQWYSGEYVGLGIELGSWAYKVWTLPPVYLPCLFEYNYLKIYSLIIHLKDVVIFWFINILTDVCLF